MSAIVNQICIETVMDATDPDIEFDSQGRSNYALKYGKLIPLLIEQAGSPQGIANLEQIVQMIKKRGASKKYDCVIGLSGGVDSSFLALKAVELGLRPLAVHFDCGWNSEIAVANINNIVNKLNIDLVTEVVDWREMKDLQLSFFKASVPNCDIPTDHAFSAVALREASRRGIKFILSGGNYASESILPESWGHNAQDLRHLNAIQRKFGSVKLRHYPKLGIMKRQIWYKQFRGIQTIRLLDYLPYDKEKAKSEIISKLDWKDYGGKHHESIFTRFFQGYYLPNKFGFDKRKAHLSSLIVAGQLSREEALAELDKPPYDLSLMQSDLSFIAKKLGLTREEFISIIEQPPRAHSEYPNLDSVYSFLLNVKQKLKRN